jgi:hypothetical protein
MIIERKETNIEQANNEKFHNEIMEARFIIKGKFQYEFKDWSTGKKFKLQQKITNSF